MLMSTLPDLPGNKRYQIKGVVCGVTEVHGRGQTHLDGALQALEQQATGLGADAIIDVKVTLSSQVAVMTGTAIKITP